MNILLDKLMFNILLLYFKRGFVVILISPVPRNNSDRVCHLDLFFTTKQY